MIIGKNMTKVESISLHVTLVKCHTSDRPAAGYIRDIRNMSDT